MASQYYVTAVLQDAHGRRMRKEFQTSIIAAADLGAEFLLADTAAQALMSDLADITELDVLEYQIRYASAVTDTVDAGANRDEGATFTVSKVGTTRRGTVKVPGPVAAIREIDGSIDITDAIVTNYFANFQAGGDFLFSDGEVVDQVIVGKLDK